MSSYGTWVSFILKPLWNHFPIHYAHTEKERKGERERGSRRKGYGLVSVFVFGILPELLLLLKEASKGIALIPKSLRKLCLVLDHAIPLDSSSGSFSISGCLCYFLNFPSNINNFSSWSFLEIQIKSLRITIPPTHDWNSTDHFNCR